MPVDSESSFHIVASRHAEKPVAGVASDMSVCDECLDELNDPSNRRFGYPFINCTNCGPRFTLIESLPFDRSRTTMRGFKLCETCRQEYETPADRRFHAEPNACHACGPKIWIVDSNEQYAEFHAVEINGTESLDSEAERVRTRGALESARGRVAQGQIVAIKGVGGFHLACDATNLRAVQKLRHRKRRPDKPLAVGESSSFSISILK